MIEFNLLPDVKLNYVKTQRTKRLVMLVSQLAIVVALVILVFFVIFVKVIQAKNISDLNNDINTSDNQLKNIPNLNKILTIQNQLQSLPAIEKQLPVSSRLFNYIFAVTPTQVTISDFQADFGAAALSGNGTGNSFTITGDADTIATVNQFVDTLKFTTYSTSSTPSSSPPNAFSNVQLSSFSVSTATGNGPDVSFTIQLNFDPTIFQAGINPTLNVPKEITTRSVTEQPSVLFKQSTTTTNQ